jgi:hypothetical protein
LLTATAIENIYIILVELQSQAFLSETLIIWACTSLHVVVVKNSISIAHKNIKWEIDKAGEEHF